MKNCKLRSRSSNIYALRTVLICVTEVSENAMRGTISDCETATVSCVVIRCPV